MILFYLILDCVDGNIARVIGTANRIGKLSDAIAGLLFWALVFPSIGLGATPDTIYFKDLQFLMPYMGFTIVIIFFLSRLISQHIKVDNTDFSERDENSSSFFFLMIKSFYDALPILYIITLLTSMVDILLIIFLVYFIGSFFFIVSFSYNLLSSTLDNDPQKKN